MGERLRYSLAGTVAGAVLIAGGIEMTQTPSQTSELHAVPFPRPTPVEVPTPAIYNENKTSHVGKTPEATKSPHTGAGGLKDIKSAITENVIPVFIATAMPAGIEAANLKQKQHKV